jgi:hypothetical protein
MIYLCDFAVGMTITIGPHIIDTNVSILGPTIGMSFAWHVMLAQKVRLRLTILYTEF